MQKVTDKGTGTVRLATASVEAKARMEESKGAYAKAKKSYDSAVQSAAEAEVNHYKMMHAESVDPHKLAESRSAFESAKSACDDAKKAMVVAEADTYKDFESESEEEETKESKVEEQKETPKEEKTAEAAEAAPAVAVAAVEAAPAPAAGEVVVPIKVEVPGDALASLTKVVEGLAATVATLQETMAKAADKPAFLDKKDEEEEEKEEAEAADEEEDEEESEEAEAKSVKPMATAAKPVQKDAIARAHVNFNAKTGSSVVVLGNKAPTGEGVATASEQGKPDLTGLFRRNK